MIFSVWTKWIRAKGKEMKNRKKRSSDMKRNENSGNDVKRNENSGGYGAVNISTPTSISIPTSVSVSVSEITELFISVNKHLDRVF